MDKRCECYANHWCETCLKGSGEVDRDEKGNLQKDKDDDAYTPYADSMDYRY